MGIIQIDMHLRDERVLEYVRTNSLSGLTQEQLAVAFRCHRHTMARILRRLEGAGHIRIVRRARKLGHVYEVV